MTHPTIAVGVSSWNYDAWRGVFYPEKLARADYLSFYAGEFATVEVNTSFYALPKPATLINWVESTPPGFTFALKAPRQITHEKRLRDCESETLALLDAIRSLGDAAAPAFLQFPPDFTRRHFGRVLADYLDWLAPRLEGVRMAVEVRAADLMTPAFAAFLAERGLALVLVDREGTPDLFETWDEARHHDNAPDFTFIRWIGDDRNGPQGDRELVNPRDAELARWAARIADYHNSGIHVYGYMHNPYEGHSPASVRRLWTRLAEHIPPPAWPPHDWPPAGAENEKPAQLSLFDENNPT
ncbi:MAG: DUF72 domain-containing protein [Caldilineaceae bacterium]